MDDLSLQHCCHYDCIRPLVELTQVLAEGDKPVPHNDALEEDLEDIDEDADVSGIAQISRHVRVVFALSW